MKITLSFSEQLKLFRKSKKISQYTFANTLGMHQPQVARWESGKNQPTLESIARIKATYPDFQPVL